MAQQAEATPTHPTIRRLEDRPLITGMGQYVDDLKFTPPPLHINFVRSPYAHAVIKSIDFSAASELSGVVGIYTATDFEGKIKPFMINPSPTARDTKRLPLASGKVRYVGDPVAVVVATSRTVARDALDLVEVDYDPLDAVVDIETALEPGAPLLYEEFGTNLGFEYNQKAGDIESAFSNAAEVVKVKLLNQRLAPVSIEPRAIAVDYDPAQDFMTIWNSTQAVYRNRNQICDLLGLPVDKVRVIALDCGGAFGLKSRIGSEETLACYLARELQRPVKWIETRSENMMGSTHGRGQLHELELALSAEGKLLGLRGQILGDVGAYLHGVNVFVPFTTSSMLSGQYVLPAIDVKVKGVLTNKIPIYPYRGAGRPEATYSVERLMDVAAHRLGLDPAELRRRNFIAPGSFPYRVVTGQQYDSGNYPVLLDTALKAAGYDEWRKVQAAQPERAIGIGLATFIEVAAGPMPLPPGTPAERAYANLLPDGTVELISGVTTNGQSHATTQATLVAQRLGLSYEQVSVKFGDTNLPALGQGTFGSRSTALAGSAVKIATDHLYEKIVNAAADLLEAAPQDLELVDGGVQVKGLPARRLTFKQVAEASGGLSVEGSFSPETATFPSGAHLAVVELDRNTGEVAILKYVAVDDAGNIIMPALAEGQVMGSLAQGIAQALYEEVVYDEYGQLLSGTLLDYAVPTAEMVPQVDSYFVETPSPTNPLGAKGIGESGCMGGTPAIVNAVLDALRHQNIAADELGLDMPLRPEKLWQALNGL